MPPPRDNLPLLLALDGGCGNRGLSTLLLLQEIAHRLHYDLEREGQVARPLTDYFYVTCGTGSGGWIALMLGPLGMHPDQAYQAYVNIYRAMYNTPMESSVDTRTTIFEREVKALTKECLGDANRVLDPSRSRNVDSPRKTFVCAMPDVNLTHPRLFRTYPVRENPSYNCMIWEAARASTAMPKELNRIWIGSRFRGEYYIDGGLGCNNPTTQLIIEAEANLKLRKGGYRILSIGAGHPGAINHPEGSHLGPTALKIALDCEKEAAAHRDQWRSLPGQYIRLNVLCGLETFRTSEGWKDAEQVTTITKSYIQRHEVHGTIEQIVKLLKAQHYPMHAG